ncbi:MAG: hypothetical protein ACTSPK_00150 [Candidatus Heimdallarchaeota archaeon]
MKEDYDSYILDNQVVASEGKLPYNEDGKTIWKYKRWSNLKKFVGVKVPIVDGHPTDAKGKSTLVSTDTKIYGYGTYKECPIIKKVLCASMNLDDDAPKRKGYSNGYLYAEDKVKEGEDGDLVQDIQRMDHIALTDFMRNDVARRKVAVAGDTSENNEVNKYYIGHDSFKFQPIVDNRSDKSVKIMSAEKEKVLLDEIDALRKENESYKGKKSAKLKKDLDSKVVEFDKLKSSYDEREEEFKNMKEQIDALEKEKQAKVIADMDSKVNSLLKIGVKKEELKDKSFDHIHGRWTQAIFNAKRQSNVKINEVQSDALGKKKFRSTADFKWDGDSWV